jgi:rare lipoprotein A
MYYPITTKVLRYFGNIFGKLVVSIQIRLSLQKMRQLFLLLLIIFPALFFAQESNSSSGTASYYAKKFEGRKTASGQKYSNKKLTAAHKTLPFGTKVKVTNLKNKKKVVVTINDRLPKNSKRIIDLSQRAAKELDFIREGKTKVEIEIIP